VVSLVRSGSIAKVRDVVGVYMNPPGHALVYALNTATIGGTALTGNQLITEISAYVIGTPDAIGKFVLPLANPALAAVRVDFASCAADGRKGKARWATRIPAARRSRRLFRINPAIQRGGFAPYANFAYIGRELHTERWLSTSWL
jgi:hypothetical protein